jgi:hypothetical protein
VTSSAPLPWHRSFVLLIVLALALGALLPMAAPKATRAISSSLVISQVYGAGSGVVPPVP